MTSAPARRGDATSEAGHKGRLYLTRTLWLPQKPLEALNYRMGDWLRQAMPPLPLAGEAALRTFPRLAEIGRNHEVIKQELFTVLESSAPIPSLVEWAAGVVRCHYPLVTPRDHEQCAITVDDTRHAWREGEPFVFDDTRRHSVRNATDEVRVVLIVDFEPPFRGARKAYSRFRYHAIRHSTEIREICRRAAAYGDIPI